MISRQEAVILSMTPKERRNPDLIKASRKVRIAKGAGVTVQDVNRLLKQYQQMAGMMKQMSKLGQKGMMRHGLGALMGKTPFH
jgi:signal recognition particle subunit SRP54